MCVCGLHTSVCDYVAPTEYDPQYGMYSADEGRVGEKLAAGIFQNCITLAFKESFYVDTDGVLKGYRWFNLPGRIYLWFVNWYSEGRIDKETTDKIEETFNFILGIRRDIGTPNEEYGDCSLGPTDFTYNEKFYYPYTSLAKKVIKHYPRNTHPTLYGLSHRILHERPVWIQVESEGKMGTYKNIASVAKGSCYERTTVWE